MNRKEILWATALCSLLLPAGCTQKPLEVTDRSFDFEVRVEQKEMGERDIPHFVATLTRGDSEEEYAVDYDIDGNRDLILQDAGGRPLTPGMKVRFGDTRTATFRTDMDEEGEHELRLKLSSDVYSLEKTVPFTVASCQHRMKVTVDTTGSRLSTLEVSLLEGRKDRDYSYTVYIDGRPVLSEKERTCRFDEFPVFRTELPLIRPGDHSVSLVTVWKDVKDSTGTTFQEPLRHRSVRVEIRNSLLNHVTVTVKDNPYGLRFKGTAIGYATGQVQYYEGRETVYRKPEMTVSTINEQIEVDFREPDPQGCIASVNLNELRSRIEEKTISSAMWRREWDQDGYEYWYVTGYEPLNYSLTKTSVGIFLDCEDMEGVWIDLEVSAGNILFNGIPVNSGSRLKIKTTNEQKWWEDILG